MIEQRRKLMAMLAGVVKGLTNLEQVLPVAGALAKRHVSYGAKAEHYPVVGAALLWTLEKGLGDGWTPEVADAWGTAYGTLSGYMISEAYGRSQAPSKLRRQDLGASDESIPSASDDYSVSEIRLEEVR
jgi:nitric oxide dioxygenase